LTELLAQPSPTVDITGPATAWSDAASKAAGIKRFIILPSYAKKYGLDQYVTISMRQTMR
jgi:hypothetical protein